MHWNTEISKFVPFNSTTSILCVLLWSSYLVNFESIWKDSLQLIWQYHQNPVQTFVSKVERLSGKHRYLVICRDFNRTSRYLWVRDIRSGLSILIPWWSYINTCIRTCIHWTHILFINAHSYIWLNIFKWSFAKYILIFVKTIKLKNHYFVNNTTLHYLYSRRFTTVNTIATIGPLRQSSLVNSEKT